MHRQQKTEVSYGFPEVSAVSGNFPLRFSMHREHKLPELIISQTKRTEKIESVTFPCLNQTGEGSRFRFFGPEYDDYDDDAGHHDDDDHDDDADDDDQHDDGGYDGDDDDDDGTTRANPPPLKI